MLYAFPFPDDIYSLVMDARAGVDRRVEVEPDKYAEQIALKAEILNSEAAAYFQCPPAADPLAWEAIELLLPDMAFAWPAHFSLAQDGQTWTWTNHLLHTRTAFCLGDAASLPFAPLDWLGRQVQEDLILMAASGSEGPVCVAGHLCFASGWSLGDKIGKTMAEIHAPVPGFAEHIGKPVDLLMKRLRANRPVARINGTIQATHQLNLSPALAEQWQASREDVTPLNAGELCVLRLERQTLSRLPRSGGALFTIHTYLKPLSEVAADPANRKRLASVLRSMPTDTRDYKGLVSYIDPLLAFLDQTMEHATEEATHA